jgi:tRNA threonylcarbamoyl adenosine modification protein YeaZ
MNILALETCFKGASVSLFKDGKIYTKEEKRENKQSDTLAEMTEALLLDHNMKISELETVIVNKGPGSFTGIRIGLSFAEGLCFGGKMQKLFASSFLTALGSCPSITLVKDLLVILHAIRDTFYIQRFSPEFKELGQPEYLTLEQVQNVINTNEYQIFGSFEAFDLQLKSNSECYSNNIIDSTAKINSESLINALIHFPWLFTTSNAPLYLRSAVNF